MLTLISGGAASGKSEYAESVAASYIGRRLYIATMMPVGAGAQAKISRHRALRAGKGFETLECPENLLGLAFPDGCTVLLECLSNLAANECFGPLGFEGAAERMLAGVDRLLESSRELIIVTNELFSDGAAYSPETLRYLDILASLNRIIAQKAGRVIEVACGIPIVWKGGLRK